VRTGDPATEILLAAEELGCDLIVAASRGRGAIGRLAFGSVADRLTRAATVPVMVVRPVDAAAEIGPALIRRMLVPYDGSEHAKEAFPVAISLAARLGAPIHVVRVITPTSYTPLAGPMEPFYSPQVLDEMLGEIEAEAKSSIDAAVAELGARGAAVTGEVRTGVPAATLQELSLQGDLIVMTSHGRSGMMRWLLGSVAEQLVREGPVPVLLVPARARADASAES
jgi:nucleotide-binding universal stress UspA family protein